MYFIPTQSVQIIVHGSNCADNNRNRHSGFGICRWMGGASEYQSFTNYLDESFRGVWEKGRQAQAIPQNMDAWCPGSLRTNPADLHRRARSAGPTSAEVICFEIGSWLDHPGSYYSVSMRVPPERTGPPSRRKVEAARGSAKIFEMNDCTPGSILVQRFIIKI